MLDLIFFYLQIKYLEEAVARSKDQKFKIKLDKLNEEIKNSKRITNLDLIDQYTKKFEGNVEYKENINKAFKKK